MTSEREARYKRPHGISKILKIFQQKVKGKKSWWEAASHREVACRFSCLLRAHTFELIRLVWQQQKAFGGLIMVRGWLFKAVTLEGERTFGGAECARCEQVRAAGTVAGAELCHRKPALVAQLSTGSCQREGDERNGL